MSATVIGEITDQDTSGVGMLPFDLGVYESRSLSPETTIDRLLPLDANGNSLANKAWFGLQRYEWIPLPGAVLKDYTDNEAHVTVEVNAEIANCNNIILILEGDKTTVETHIASLTPPSQHIDEIHQDLNTIEKYMKELKKNGDLKTNLGSYLLRYNILTDPNHSVFKIEYQHAGIDNIPVRYGVCSKLFANLCDTNSKNTLTQVEYHALYSAIQYLNTKDPADIAPSGATYKNNIALCDIFVRDNAIIGKAKTIPDIHTIVLWKIKNAVPGSSNAQIILIDPSKCDFSKFVAGTGVTDADIVTVGDAFSALKEHYEMFYGRGSIEDGRKLNEARDCIDIAVKIGFKLNELQQHANDIQQILLDLHGSMSNAKVPGFSSKAPGLMLMRDAHKSDPTVRDLFRYLCKTVEGLKNIPQEARKEAFNSKMWS